MGTAWLIALFGIVLPAVSITVELVNGMCAETFFDPIPTLAHVLLVWFVPLANLVGLIAWLRTATKWRSLLLWSNGVVLGIAFVYSLIFLPLTPLAIFALLIFGLGLLPLTPLCSLFAAIALRVQLVRMAAAQPVALTPRAAVASPSSLRSLLGGAAVGILLLIALESRIALTRFAAEMVVSGSPQRVALGVSLLRQFGSRDELLRMCYAENQRGRGFAFSARGTPMLVGHLFDDLSSEEAQKLFFRVTGLPYNALPPPRGAGRSRFDDFDFDPDIGGQVVAGRRKGLSLSSSRVDAQIHSSAALAYTEWTMVFQNDHQLQREARAQVLLPPGGVVSRVSLWVDGEPREAAFAGASETRAAYRKVAVAQRRDPLLVTWAGRDRILVQCFPVPPHGEMKIRLGITAPLVLSGSGTAALRLPNFAQRNFSVPPTNVHSLWAESDQPYRQVDDQLHLEKSSDGRHVLRGVLSEEQMVSTQGAIVVSHSGGAESWTPDPRDPKAYVVQKMVSQPLPVKRKLVVVIDGSAGMAEWFEAISDALAGVSPETELTVLVAADAVEDLSAAVGRSGDATAALAERLLAVASPGGCDNVAALLESLEYAAAGDKTIVWIHAPQPVVLQPPTPLAQRFERDPKMTLYDVAVAAGPNQVVSELPDSNNIRTVPRLGNLPDDLKGLLARLTGQSKEQQLVRTRSEGKPPATPKSSSHIARLWAADQVLALVRSGKPGSRLEAGKLAAAYQLVTLVSGAVVLENQQQYDESKLKPADPASTPNIPEPSTLALLFATLPALGWLAWRRRRAARGLDVGMTKAEG